MGDASAIVKLTIEAREILSSAIKAGVVPSTVLEDLDLRNGTSDGQIDLAFARTETAKAASSTTTYALDGTVTDSYGIAITFAEVVLVLVRNRRTTALAWLQVGPNGANGFGVLNGNKGLWNVAADRSTVGPEGWYCAYDPVGVVVDGTHSDLDVDCSAVAGATNSWDILILGRSA